MPKFALLLPLVAALPWAPAAAEEPPAQRDPALTVSAADADLKWEPCPGFFPKGCELALLHGDLDEQDSDVFLRVPAGYAIPRHWHPAAERIVVVAGELQVANDGRKPADLKPGHFAYVPPKLNHRAVCGKAGPCVLFLSLDGPVEAEEPGETSVPPAADAPKPAPGPAK